MPKRAGSQALSIFSRVLSAEVLRAHSDGPIGSAELETRLGWAAKASLRVAAAGLCELGALDCAGQRALARELTPAGGDLLDLADALENWLSGSPFGPLELPEAAARGTVGAFVAGWESTMIHALAVGPGSLAELGVAIPDHSYSTLKRRLAKLRATSLAARADDRARSPKHLATPLLRRVVRPLSLAARWEHRYMPAAPPFDRRDLAAALYLTLPLVELPLEASGTCVLVAPDDDDQDDDRQSQVAVGIAVGNGGATAFDPGAAPASTTRVSGSGDDWLDALFAGQTGRLRIRGADIGFATLVVAQVAKAQTTASDKVRRKRRAQPRRRE